MDTVIAKVGKEYFRVLSRGMNIVPSLNLSKIEGVPYEPSYKLEDDEWFSIEDFSNSDFMVPPHGFII